MPCCIRFLALGVRGGGEPGAGRQRKAWALSRHERLGRLSEGGGSVLPRGKSGALPGVETEELSCIGGGVVLPRVDVVVLPRAEGKVLVCKGGGAVEPGALPRVVECVGVSGRTSVSSLAISSMVGTEGKGA